MENSPLTYNYEKKYFIGEIAGGLKFYYEYICGREPAIFLEEKFPIKPVEIITTLEYLKRIPKEDRIHRMVYSHPYIADALDNIEHCRECTEDDEKYEAARYFVFPWMEYLLYICCNALFSKFRLDFFEQTKNKNPSDILKLLITLKSGYKLNKENYSSRYLTQANEFLEIEIEKTKELLSIDMARISDEANTMIQDYLNQLREYRVQDDLYASLMDRDYTGFGRKLKRLLYIPSYHDIRKTDSERSFHIFLLGVLAGKLENYSVKSNKESGVGRYDIALVPRDAKDPGIIIEIKKVRENIPLAAIDKELDLALEQMNTKNYRYELQEDGSTEILQIAIVFNGIEPNLKFALCN